MIKFLFKKSFYDGWDNFLVVFVSNVVYALLLSAFIFANIKLDVSFTQLIIMVVVLALLFALYSFGINGISYIFSQRDDDDNNWWRSFCNTYKTKTSHLLLYIAIVLILSLFIFVAIPYYFSVAGVFGIFLGVFICWLVLFVVISMQYYLPLTLLLPSDKPLETLKKSLAMFAGNKAFTLFVTLKTLFVVIISIPTAYLIPGFAGINIGHMAATKILIVRYDYMREHGITNTKKIDMEEMFSDEDKKIGKRTLKSTFFPWKGEYGDKRKTKQDS